MKTHKVLKYSWIPADLGLLDTMTDTDNAKKLGISRAQVEVRLKRMGIPRHIPKKPERVWLPEHDALLGVKTDSEVAALLGITRHIVQARRNKLGIPRQYSSRKVHTTWFRWSGGNLLSYSVPISTL